MSLSPLMNAQTLFFGENSNSKVYCDFGRINNLFHSLKKWRIYIDHQSTTNQQTLTNSDRK